MKKKNLFATIFCLGLALVACANACAQVSVWTHRYDNARTGANLAETQLNTSNVNASQFGKLFSYAVDADIYTQPLVIENVSISGKGMHNVVYVATNNNSVYAFDADTNQGANALPLWQMNFNGPGVTPIPASDVGTLNSIRTPGPIGIMGTPVIDQTTGTMYLVARTKETTGSNVAYVQRLHALDIGSGAEKFGGPVAIQASVAGTGYDSVGGVVIFNPLTENQRVGLALGNGNVYIAWASYGDTDPYHGWVIAYNATTLQQTGVLCITPDGQRAGIWQSGQPLSIDASGNLYVATGNGTFDGVRNFGESILRLNANLSTVLDWFTPDNWSYLNAADLDLGSAGVLLVPGTNDALGADKEGKLHVVNRGSLGHIQAGNGQIVQTIQVTGGGNIHGTPTYWSGPNGPWIYVWGEEDELKAFAFNGSTFNTVPISQSTYPAPPGMPGGFLTISANGSQAGSGILWASIPYAEDANEDIVSGVLRAFDATNLTHELWNTRMVPARDDLGNFAKFVAPTVANGRVYIASFSDRLHVYGLLASIPPASGGAIVGSGAASAGSVNLTATGTSDWAHWPGYDGKTTGNAQISDFAFLGAAATSYSTDPRTMTWNDGTPTLCASSATGVSISGTSNGFLITVPADTAIRTLKLYVGGSNSRGMLTAHLSDGSASDFVDTGFSSAGQYDAVYTLTYHAASDGGQLAVLWTQFSGSGSVTLQGAALIGASDPLPPSGCIWVDDAVPLWGTVSGTAEGWSWVSSNPPPYSGLLAHQSALANGMHQHLFYDAFTVMPVSVGDMLFAYIYLDPAHLPSEVMLQWYDGSSWEHRAYWGANLIGWGTDGTVSRRPMGALPAAGQWVLLSVPAAQVGLEGSTLTGMAYTLYDGRATWDYAGKTSAAAPTYQVSGSVTLGGAALSGVSFAATGGVTCTNSDATGSYACTVPQGWTGTVTPSLSGYTFSPASRSYSSVASNQTAQNYSATLIVSTTVWVDDAVPAGATMGGDGGDTWNWVSSNPAPYSGALAQQSAVGSGEHQHYFYNATATLPVAVGDTLFAYVYLDPANLPSEVMLQWSDGSWEHRAYWGANLIGWGTNSTVSRFFMGALPAAGQWVRLSVPAAQVGLEGHTLSGMAFTLYGGRATWDYAGKTAAAAPTYQVSGSVTLGGAALSGVSFAATGGVTCTNSDATGSYACTVPQGWTGTVTPSLSGYTFSPASRSYSSVASNQTAQTYTATAVTYQVSGTVTLSGAALSGVNFAATGGVSCTTSGATGSYACTVPQGWTGTVTPSLSGYTFSPASRSYSSVASNQTAQTYTATAVTYQVSGTVTLSGAALSGVNFAATGGVSCTTSGATGSYACTVPQGWTGTVTPSLSGYTFSPASRSYSSVASNQTAQTYTATAVTYQVSGTVTLSGAALSGVSFAATGGVTCTTSGATGSYACTVPQGWTGTVTPSLSGYTFSPASRSYSSVASNQTAQNYSATLIVSTTVWVDDAVPAGATMGGDGGDTWNWVSSNPAPYSGALAQQSAVGSGEHQHYFYNATATLPVAVGDTLFAYVYLDPANLPSEVMLQWSDGSWEHRAYWGANLIGWGTNSTVSRFFMGALPAAGQWVRLSVPAAQVGLEGHTLSGMAFTLYGGRATWDYAGKTAAAAPTYQVSGSVTLGGAALSGVSFAATGGVTCTNSDATGSYACTVPQGWTGTVTPSSSGYTFTPASRSYSSVAANQTAQNYTAALNTTTTLVSSLSPSTVGANVTFTATVSGTNPTGSVNFTDGGVSLSGCTAVALSGSGNTKTAPCSTSSLATGTHSISAAYSGDANNNGSASSALSQVVNAGGGTSINVALAANGGVASVSSSYSAAYGPAGLNDGETAGINWGNNGGWNDGTPNTWPDFAQITFNGSKTINQVVVYTVQDNYANPAPPTNTMTFSQWGVTDFTVQALINSNWVTLATIAGNNLVKRTVSFSATTTTSIRINITKGSGGYSRLTEIQAWTP